VKGVFIRLPEQVAHQLNVVAACEGVTDQDFCERGTVPEIRKDMDKLGLSAERLAG
jgi:hypothetical protein